MPSDFTLRRHSRLRLAWKVVAIVVTGVSLAWVFWLLAQVWPSLAAHRAEIAPYPLLLGFALSFAASFLAFEAFATLAGILGITGLPRRELGHLHFTSQVLKHLPGRVWGVGYQWAAGSSAAKLGDWLLVNLAHMLLATFFALWSVWLVLAFAGRAEWGLLALTGGGAAYIIGWSVVTSRRLYNWLKLLPGAFGTVGCSLMDVLAKTPVQARMMIFLFFAANSVLYYGSWYLYGMAYAPLGGSGGLRLCAYYMLAWFVGYVSLLTPSGLGVRE